jgi:hypothetical protein
MPSKEQQHPFYKPLWVRVGLVFLILAVIAFEFYHGAESMWIVIWIGFLVYAVYTFFITWPKDDGKSGG